MKMAESRGDSRKLWLAYSLLFSVTKCLPVLHTGLRTLPGSSGRR